MRFWGISSLNHPEWELIIQPWKSLISVLEPFIKANSFIITSREPFEFEDKLPFEFEDKLPTLSRLQYGCAMHSRIHTVWLEFANHQERGPFSEAPGRHPYPAGEALQPAPERPIAILRPWMAYSSSRWIAKSNKDYLSNTTKPGTFCFRTIIRIKIWLIQSPGQPK